MEKILNCLFKAPCQYCLDYVLLPDLQVHQTKVLFRAAEPEPEPVFLAGAGAEKITKFRLRLRLRLRLLVNCKAKTMNL